jgi:hypothetical protein
MPKMITLELWAAANLSPPPSINTLRAWARDGRFAPAAVKHGRTYYVYEDARYCDPPLLPRQRGQSLISRIERARHGAKAA